MKKLHAKRFGHYLESNGSEGKTTKDLRQWREMVNLCFLGRSLGESMKEPGDKKTL